MVIEKRTGKALLVARGGVSFWIQKRWLKSDGTLTPMGLKAYHIALRSRRENASYDAFEEFAIVRQTEKAALLRCTAVSPDGTVTPAEFWLPRSMRNDKAFADGKVREVEGLFPFIGPSVRRNGACNGNQPPGGKGPALTGGGSLPPRPERPGDFI
jgi:hypothetical protein